MLPARAPGFLQHWGPARPWRLKEERPSGSGNQSGLSHPLPSPRKTPLLVILWLPHPQPRCLGSPSEVCTVTRFSRGDPKLLTHAVQRITPQAWGRRFCKLETCGSEHPRQDQGRPAAPKGPRPPGLRFWRLVHHVHQAPESAQKEPVGFPFLFGYWLRCFLSSGLRGVKASHFHIRITVRKPGFRASAVRASSFRFLRGPRASSLLG